MKRKKIFTKEKLGGLVGKFRLWLKAFWNKGWRFLSEKWLTDPPPRAEGLWWIVPPRRIAATITVCIIALIALGSFGWMRQQDADFDHTDKFEQTAYLQNRFGTDKEEVILTSNLFGKEADMEGEPSAKLKNIGVNGERRRLAIDSDSVKKNVCFTAKIITPQRREITLVAGPQSKNLEQALERLADWKLLQRHAGTSVRGKIYTFDLEWDVFRGEHTLGVYRERFHLRADGPVEIFATLLMAMLIVVAIIFVADFTYPVLDYRAKKHLKMLAGFTSEVLYYVEYALDTANKFPDGSQLVADEVVELLKKTVEALEKYIAHSDQEEAPEIYSQAQELIRLVQNFEGEQPLSEAGLEKLKLHWAEVYEKTKKLHERVEQLRARPFHTKPAISVQETAKVEVEMRSLVWERFGKLKEISDKVTAKRDQRKKLHQKSKDDFCLKYASALTNYLNQESIKRDIQKLGKFFPIEQDIRVWETRGIRTEGVTDFEDSQPIGYHFEYFDLLISVGEASELTLRIQKNSEDVSVFYYEGEKDKERGPAIIKLPARDPWDKENPIQYKIEVQPAGKNIERRKLQFKVKPSDIKLIDPQPDPTPWFEEMPQPDPPKTPAPTNPEA